MTIDQQLIRSEAKDYFFLTVGLIIYAAAFTVFLMPYEIVTGGVTGMSAVIYYATGFKIENTYMIINISLLIVALKILGFKFLMKTIYAIFALYFLLIFAQDLMPKDATGHFVKMLGEGQAFMSLIIGCSLTGTGLAIVFLNNGSTGGTDIIAACVNKYHDIQFGDVMERLHKMVFGYCTMFIECFMLDHVMNMRRESVQFMIFSWKHEEIANAIVEETEHALTILDGHGWYTGNDMKVICLLAKRNESKTIFRIIKMVDPTAFVSQSSVIGVYGEGFDQIKIKAKKEMKKQEKKLAEAMKKPANEQK